jgi:hypothetical protein
VTRLPAYYSQEGLYSMELMLLTTCANSKLEDTFSAVRNSFINYIRSYYTLRIWRPSPPSTTWGRTGPWWQGSHVTSMGETSHRILMRWPLGRCPIWRPRRRWEDNIKIDLRKMLCSDWRWMEMVQDHVQFRTFLLAMLNCWVPLPMLRGSFIYSRPRLSCGSFVSVAKLCLRRREWPCHNYIRCEMLL